MFVLFISGSPEPSTQYVGQVTHSALVHPVPPSWKHTSPDGQLALGYHNGPTPTSKLSALKIFTTVNFIPKRLPTQHDVFKK